MTAGGNIYLPVTTAQSLSVTFDTAIATSTTCDGNVIPGCISAAACNYNSSANTDDGSCNFPIFYHPDADGDGFGSANSGMLSCTPINGWILDDSDCDDSDENVFPGAPPTGQGNDNNCDGVMDAGELDPNCPWDLDGSGTINTNDMLLYMAQVGCYTFCTADFDSNGVVGITDLLFFMVHFNEVCN